MARTLIVLFFCVADCAGITAHAASLKWSQQFFTTDSVDEDGSYGVSADKLGNVFVAGTRRENPGVTFTTDAFINKYDASGNLRWTQSLGTSSDDAGYGVAADGLGNVYLTGVTYGNCN